MKKRRVLQGYRQEGKRFIPPFRQLAGLQETSWIDDRVPELIWIALLMHVYGRQQGTAVATNIAKAAAQCDSTAPRAFAATSDYRELSDEQKQCVRSRLNAEDTLGTARRGLAALIHHYTAFPLAFLADPERANEDPLDSTLDDLKATIANISDRAGHAGTFVQATVVYIYFVNNRLTVSPAVSLANFPAIEDYPATEESMKVAAAIRASVSSLLTQDVPSDWRNAFWTQSRTFGSCEMD